MTRGDARGVHPPGSLFDRQCSAVRLRAHAPYSPRMRLFSGSKGALR